MLCHPEERGITLETPHQNRQSLSSLVCDPSFLGMTQMGNQLGANLCQSLKL